jgi:uncharacterized PurR-regulated membrane protein YhhQ (DUF165 family)
VKHQRRQWYFVHILAILTAATTVMFFWLQSQFDLAAENPQIPPRIAIIALIGTIAMFWFWIRMMAACFRERPARRAVAWGWFMVLGFMFGALAYFVAVWRPAHRPN